MYFACWAVSLVALEINILKMYYACWAVSLKRVISKMLFKRAQIGLQWFIPFVIRKGIDWVFGTKSNI